jgi:aspartyl/glutamyl-tRNA(Asn/Gln) amidotransferase C subunit
MLTSHPQASFPVTTARYLTENKDQNRMDFDLAKIAGLARLKLEPGEAKKIGKDLLSILEYVRSLESLDTRDVPPTSHVLDLENIFRQDAMKESGVREAALKNAPMREGDFFKVPKIVEKE